MKVVVAGARGGIGRVVLRRLRDAGHDVTPLTRQDLDLSTDAEALRRFMAASMPEAIVHLAGSKPPASTTDMYAVNASVTYMLLEAARLEAPCAQHVVTSSAAVYGQPPGAYGISKRVAESIALYYKAAFASRVRVLRLFNVTSVEDDTTSVIPQLFERMRREPDAEFPLRDQDATRDFIDVDDVARVFELALTGGPEILDVGNGAGVTIRSVAELVRTGAGASVRIVDGGSSGHMIHSVADVSGLQSLGFAPRLSPQDAIERNVAKLAALYRR